MSGRCRNVFIVLFATNFALSASGAVAYPAKENAKQNAETLSFPLSISDYTQQGASHQSDPSDRPKSNCYHFYVSRNMSSLLADATKMLRQVHDKREREWIMTFIYRIKSLAEHLRSHPESQNYEECMSGEDDKKKSSILSETLRINQPELYFVDDMLPTQNQKRDSGSAKDPEVEVASGPTPDDGPKQNNQKASQEQSLSNVPLQQMSAENFNSIAESTSESVSSLKKDVETHHPSDSVPTSAGAGNQELTSVKESVQPMTDQYGTMLADEQVPNVDDGSAIIVSSPEPECQSEVKCSEINKREDDQTNKRSSREDDLVQQLHARQQARNAEADRQHQMLLKEHIRAALLEELLPELKKLRTVGGTEEDLIELWKESEIEVEKDEAEKSRDNDFDYEEIGAAAGDLNSNDKYPPNYRTVAPSSDQVGNYKKQSDEQPYVHNDVLVQQLYDVREEEPQYRPTRSLRDQNDEYLIISTNIPY